jgi:hypothetical protein
MATLWHTMQECKQRYPCLACVCDTRLKVVNRVVQDRQEIGKEEIPYGPEIFNQRIYVHISYSLQDLHKYCFTFTMRTNLPKLLDLLIFCRHSLNFSLEFFTMIFFVTNQLNISKFLPLQIRKTLISY